MFPMRDHLYELAKAQEIELLEKARREEQLAQAKNYDYETWSWESMRRLWQMFFGGSQQAATPPQTGRRNTGRRGADRQGINRQGVGREGAAREEAIHEGGAPPGLPA